MQVWSLTIVSGNKGGHQSSHFRPSTETEASQDTLLSRWSSYSVRLKLTSVTSIDPEIIRSAVESTLSNLSFKPDVLLIHNPHVFGVGKIGQGWKILESLVEDGTLAGVSLGVSNFRPQDLQEILDVCKIKPAINRKFRSCSYYTFHGFWTRSEVLNAALRARNGIPSLHTRPDRRTRSPAI